MRTVVGDLCLAPAVKGIDQFSSAGCVGDAGTVVHWLVVEVDVVGLASSSAKPDMS